MADGSPIILTIQVGMALGGKKRPPTPSNVVELFITEANMPQLEQFLKSSEVASELWTVSFMMAAAPLFAATVVTSVAKAMGCTVENEVHRQIFLTPEQLPASPALTGVTMQPLDETHIPKLLSRWPYSSVVTDAARLVLGPVRAGLSMGVFAKTHEHTQQAGREQRGVERKQQLHAEAAQEGLLAVEVSRLLAHMQGRGTDEEAAEEVADVEEDIHSEEAVVEEALEVVEVETL
ncbi:hypothetical protein FJT64_000433 [Amphibalanus amphitrite]|nr:hypothetical protein FJT64_000433 [Amphibalanus amphitrite]